MFRNYFVFYSMVFARRESSPLWLITVRCSGIIMAYDHHHHHDHDHNIIVIMIMILTMI